MVEKYGYVSSIWEHSSSFFWLLCLSHFCSRILLDLMCFSLPLCLSLSFCIPITPAGFLVVCLPRWQIPLGFEPEITMATALLPLEHIDRSVVAQREMLLYQQSEHARISQISHSNVLSPFSSHQTRRAMHVMPMTSCA